MEEIPRFARDDTKDAPFDKLRGDRDDKSKPHSNTTNNIASLTNRWATLQAAGNTNKPDGLDKKHASLIRHA